MTSQEEIHSLRVQLEKAKKSGFRGRIGNVVLGILMFLNGIYGFTQSIEAAKQRELASEAFRISVMAGEEAEMTRDRAIAAAQETAKALEECVKLRKVNQAPRD